MPIVGKGKNAKHFSYSPKGVKAAKEFSKKTGDKMVYRKV